WECADPGMQFDTTINRWHTAATTGRINGSNPCSEYMHLDNSACNLASLNLLTFLDGDDNFDVDGFKAAVEVFFTAQEILVGNAERMNRVLRRHRDELRTVDEELVPPELLSAAQESWDEAVELGQQNGVRNSQATVLAPTGTIGLLMDCDTTGIEPDLGLVKT